MLKNYAYLELCYEHWKGKFGKKLFKEQFKENINQYKYIIHFSLKLI